MKHGHVAIKPFGQWSLSSSLVKCKANWIFFPTSM